MKHRSTGERDPLRADCEESREHAGTRSRNDWKFSCSERRVLYLARGRCTSERVYIQVLQCVFAATLLHFQWTCLISKLFLLSFSSVVLNHILDLYKQNNGGNKAQLLQFQVWRLFFLFFVFVSSFSIFFSFGRRRVKATGDLNCSPLFVPSVMKLMSSTLATLLWALLEVSKGFLVLLGINCNVNLLFFK